MAEASAALPISMVKADKLFEESPSHTFGNLTLNGNHSRDRRRSRVQPVKVTYFISLEDEFRYKKMSHMTFVSLHR